MTKSLPPLTKAIPTIFISGDSDTFALRIPAAKSRNKCSHAKFHWVAGAGHQVQADNPDETAKIIRAFL